MSRRVVVTGMGAVSPLGNDVETSFARLKVFENCVQALPELSEYKGLNTHLGCRTSFVRPSAWTRKTTRTMGDVAQYALAATEQAVAQAGGLCTAASAGGETSAGQFLTGNVTVYAPVSSPAFFVRNNNGNPFTINSTISGSGCLGVKVDGKNGRATFAFGGENSGFTGPLHVGADGNDDYVTLRISSKANIGGNPPARLERGLWVLYRCTLQATETLTLDDPNRVVNFDTCFVKVDAGKTLTIRKYNVTIGEEEVELDGETRVRFYAMLAPRGLVVVVK